MSSFKNKINKVLLSDYDYLFDIESRVLLNNISNKELEVLTELIDNSLNTTIENLSQDLETNKDQLLPILNRLSKLKLFSLNGSSITIDKEKRKYLEHQIERFEENFRPDIEYFKKLINKVSIQFFSMWYSLLNTSDNVVESFIEKRLVTPKIYLKYIENLYLEEEDEKKDDDLILQKNIMEDVFNHPLHQVEASEIRKKYSLSEKQLEEQLLYLEFQYICCSRYTQKGDSWKLVITPFYEWKTYLDFLQKTTLKTSENTPLIPSSTTPPFSFIKEIETTIQNIKTNPLTSPSQYNETVINKLEQTGLAEVSNETIAIQPKAEEWLSLKTSEKALFLHRYPMLPSKEAPFDPNLFSDKTFLGIEKSLSSLVHLGWVRFDDFLNSMTVAIGSTEPTHLTKIGRRWLYQTPQYTQKEKQFIQTVIETHLTQLNIVETELFENTLYLKITSFGKTVLAD